MKTVLLTGVAGFIANKTAEFLLRDGYQVVGIDNMNDYYDVRSERVPT
jgi:UDP-glucuronate 4-epimerase